MVDTKKVIYSIERCVCYAPDACRGCAYADYSYDECVEVLLKDILALLKKQEKGTMMKYRKRPVVIEAYQTDKELDIETLEGTMHANAGDWIITGVNGEQYPCKPDIFEKTYEPVSD